MNIPHSTALAGALGALALLAAACIGSDGDAPPAPPPTTAPAPTTTDAPITEDGDSDADSDADGDGDSDADAQQAAGPPHAAPLAWGNFALAPRIADKLAAGDALNLVVSLTATGEGSPAASFEHGWSRAAAELADRHGVEVNGRVIGPNSADAAAQAGTIASLVASGDIDCLAVEAAAPRLLLDAIDQAVDAGVPAVTVGADTPDSKRFAFYGIDAYAVGEAAGQRVGAWAAEGGILMRRGGVLTGDGADQQSFDAMRGFVDGMSEIHSALEWVNTPADVTSLGFDPFLVYDRTEAWVAENLDVDIVFHTDAGLEALAQVMSDRLLYGDMYAVGMHMSAPIGDYIRERLVVDAVVEGFAEQAYRAGLACGSFLLAGELETGHVTHEPVAVNSDNVDERDWTLPENR